MEEGRTSADLFPEEVQPLPPRPVRNPTTESSWTVDSRDSANSFGFDANTDEDEGDASAVPEAPDEVLSAVDLAREQEGHIKQIVSLFAVSRQTASVLLRKYRWKSERLISDYFEEPAAVLEKAGLNASATSAAGLGKRPRNGGDSSEGSSGVECGVCSSEGSRGIECGVCFCEVSPSESSELGCGHTFCNDCWSGHLHSQLGDGNAQSIACMTHGCSVLVEPSLAQALLDAPTYAKFARFAQQQFVDESPNLKYCPAPGCDKVIKVGDLGRSETVCTCGMAFCFRCSREAHFPCSCEVLSEWETRVKSDGATGEWFKANSRRCRKCQANIEKNGGCNWIVCRCGHQFCYFCYSTDKGHHGQPCNAPPPAEAADAQSSLDYFMHYYDRFEGHRKSQELETELRERAHARMAELVADPATRAIQVDVQYIGEAVEALISCRRLLRFTYAFAFSIRKCNAKLIFEDLQAQLESVTEALAGLLEADGEPDKPQIIATAAGAKVRLRNMRGMLESSPAAPGAWADVEASWPE
jgi:ariadne-1